MIIAPQADRSCRNNLSSLSGSSSTPVFVVDYLIIPLFWLLDAMVWPWLQEGLLLVLVVVLLGGLLNFSPPPSSSSPWLDAHVCLEGKLMSHSSFAFPKTGE